MFLFHNFSFYFLFFGEWIGLSNGRLWFAIASFSRYVYPSSSSSSLYLFIFVNDFLFPHVIDVYETHDIDDIFKSRHTLYFFKLEYLYYFWGLNLYMIILSNGGKDGVLNISKPYYLTFIQNSSSNVLLNFSTHAYDRTYR